MPGVFVGETKCLVFPTMCDGFLKQVYLDKNESDTALALRGGLWGLDSFTLEALITPYDVNGYGTKTGSGIGLATSEKTPPSLSENISSNLTHYQSYKYFGTNRYSQKMMLFYNTNYQLYLENTTTSNINRPAEYKLVAEFADGTPTKVESDTIISANNNLHGYYNVNAFYDNTTTNLRKISGNATNISPSNTISIDSNSLPVNVAAAAATGTVTFSSNPPDSDKYYPAQNAKGTITLVSNSMSVDTYPVGEVAKVKFGANPIIATGSEATDCIDITKEDGTGPTHWFCYNTGGNGQALPAPFPVNSYRYLRGADTEATIRNLAQAIDSYNAGFLGTTTYNTTEANPVLGGATLYVCELHAAIQGSTPNRLGITSAVCAFGTYFNAGNHSEVYVGDFTGGINEVVVANNYFTITDSTSSSKKYHPYPDNSSAPATGTTDTRATIGTVTAFRVKSTLSGTIQQLSAAINNNTNGNAGATSVLADGGAVAIDITNDAAGTAGNSSTITKTNIANGIATFVDFAGGLVGNAPHKYIQLTDSDGTVLKYHPVHSVYTSYTDGATFSYGGIDYIAFLVWNSSASITFKDAVNHSNSSALDITGSVYQGVVTLTQGTVGTNGNGAGKLTENVTNVSESGFAGGIDAANPANYISLTSAQNTLIKYKAATVETTASTDGTYVFFRLGNTTTDTANNLITAINDVTNGHAGAITATNPASNHVVKVVVGFGGSYALTENITGVSVGSWDTSAGSVITVASGEAINIGAGEEMFNSSGVLIGTVDTTPSGDAITLDDTPAATVTSIVYASQPRESLYAETMIKLSCVVQANGTVKLYMNNQLIQSKKITITDNLGTSGFKFNPSDCFIGQNGTNVNTQFMGELYEISMFQRPEPSLTSNTLTPGHNDIVFYYRFGDE